jgi:hypothetical protein
VQVLYAEVRVQLDAADGLDRLPQLAALSVADFSQLFKKKPKRDLLIKKGNRLEEQLVSSWANEAVGKAAAAAALVTALGGQQAVGFLGPQQHPADAGPPPLAAAAEPAPAATVQAVAAAIRDALQAITQAGAVDRPQLPAVEQEPAAAGGRRAVTAAQRIAAQRRQLAEYVSNAARCVVDSTAQLAEAEGLAGLLGGASPQALQRLQAAAAVATEGAGSMKAAADMPSGLLARSQGWDLDFLLQQAWYTDGMTKLVDNKLFEYVASGLRCGLACAVVVPCTHASFRFIKLLLQACHPDSREGPGHEGTRGTEDRGGSEGETCEVLHDTDQQQTDGHTERSGHAQRLAPPTPSAPAQRQH